MHKTPQLKTGFRLRSPRYIYIFIGFLIILMLMFQFLSLKVEVKYSVKLGGDASRHTHGQQNSSIQSLSDPSKTAVRGNTVPKRIVSLLSLVHCAILYLAR